MTQTIAVRRRTSVTFDELLGFLEADGVIEAKLAERLLARKDAQLRELVRRSMQASKADGDRRPPISAIELFMSFGEKGEDDRPIREDVVTEVYAKHIGFPYVKLDPLRLDPAFSVTVLSKPFAKKHGLLAVEESGGVITFATIDPFDSWALESVERVTGKPMKLVIASKTDIDRLITEFYGFRQSVKRAEQQIAVGIDLGNLEQFVRMKSDQEIEASDEHVVHAVDYLLRYAFGERASDIHIEPKRTESVVRFRIDGSLHRVNKLPRIVHNAVVNRIKTLSRLDIAEKRRPQDGRIKTEFGARPIEIRVSTLPVAFGEKVVLRIFDPDLVHDDLEQLGFGARDKAVFEELLALPHGIILVTGPTGSGKTTTLYTALRKLATDDVNITTIEDPIEMVYEGINQTAILPAINLGFAEALRNILRQDPDIIMVGEIRDLDTARHAIQAALTGHLVFSTLHTNDAPSAITRLVDLGVEPFLVASTLSGVMAQRLVKRVCAACAVTRELAPAEAELLGLSAEGEAVTVRHGLGCADCRKTGYVGRTALVELFKVTPSIRQLIHDRAAESAIRKQARAEGMTLLREAGIDAMLAGDTSPEQVLEVTAS
ncbi:MAG: ATPase, T2SS/T4P/T4SS family [Polyangiaceae bacterium]